ncbi:hypothetical protein POKO110462_07995 [Pontibacter korlensis]|uniref:Uncharacterized protein n=1 Tax=Pontibacter korlensis TaxID=400092 RepID=A0A0E3UYU5_9BACT|nr:hypothetical protein [Pontibacter korlensis]AKD04751.1 hypothetical protein PKOR_18670 [Pontibacter korlensis]
MIYMHQFIPKDAGQRLQHWTRLQQTQIQQAILVTKDTVMEYLRQQLERGNWRDVQEVLRGKPMTRAGKFLYHELRNRVIGKLIMRLGVRKVIAVALALVLLPLILAQVAGELIKRVRS